MPTFTSTSERHLFPVLVKLLLVIIGKEDKLGQEARRPGNTEQEDWEVGGRRGGGAEGGEGKVGTIVVRVEWRNFTESAFRSIQSMSRNVSLCVFVFGYPLCISFNKSGNGWYSNNC